MQDMVAAGPGVGRLENRRELGMGSAQMVSSLRRWVGSSLDASSEWGGVWERSETSPTDRAVWKGGEVSACDENGAISGQVVTSVSMSIQVGNPASPRGPR